MRIHRKPNESILGRSAHCLLLSIIWLLGAASSGCAWDSWNVFKPKTPPLPGPADSMVLRGDQLEQVKLETGGPASQELAGALELYRKGDYGGAESLFCKIADNTKNTEMVAEEARFYQGECLYRQQKYPKASDIFTKLLNDFPSGVHREQAEKRKFDIANYWLDATREDMRLEREKKEGKRWFVWPGPVVHWEKSKPLIDQEGRALEGLDQVVMNDPMGPLADEALFLAGSVNFYRQNYKEADHYFSQIVEYHPESKYASKAVELGIISKHMSTGGSDYDGRKVAEARLLVYAAQDKYPDLAANKTAFLERQLAGINHQQAEKDFKTAEFYRRTGHPGAAYFCYEIVRRRYPGSPFAQQSTERMQELEAKLDRSRSEAGSGSVTPAAAKTRSPASAPQTGASGQPPAQPEVAPQPRTMPEQPEMAPAPRPLP